MLGFAIIGLLVGGVFLGTALNARRQLRASLSWPAVTGTILETSIRESTSVDSENNTTRCSYQPCVGYAYEVQGSNYRGHRIGFSTLAYSDRRRAEQELAPFVIGAQVPVYFDPAKPRDSVLVRKAGGSTLFLSIGALIIAGVIVMLIQYR